MKFNYSKLITIAFFSFTPIMAHADSVDKLKPLLPVETWNQIDQINHSHKTIYSIYSSYQPELPLKDVPYVLTQNKKETIVTSPDLFPKISSYNIKQFVTELNDTNQYNYQTEDCWNYSYEETADIKYMTDQYIWIESTNQNYMCGQHAIRSIEESNEIKGIGINTTLKQISKNKQTYKKIQDAFITQADSFQQDYDKQDFPKFLIKAPINFDNENFSISDGAYSFGTCYACGMHEIDVPKNKIFPLISNKYKQIFTKKEQNYHTIHMLKINTNQSVDSLIHQYIDNASLSQIIDFYNLNDNFFKIHKWEKNTNFLEETNIKVSLPFIYELHMKLGAGDGAPTVSLITHLNLLENPRTQKDINSNIQSLKNMAYILITKMNEMEEKQGVYQYLNNKWIELK